VHDALAQTHTREGHQRTPTLPQQTPRVQGPTLHAALTGGPVLHKSQCKAQRHHRCARISLPGANTTTDSSLATPTL
jgi:hypothetical protein